MLNYVTITSQGQISIPAKFRKVLGLKKSSKAIISLDGERLVITPVKDILEYSGIFKEKGAKYQPMSEILKTEKEAVEKGVLEDFEKKNRK